MPEISVIIPVYNAKRWLSSCLDSLLAQIFQDWEAICVDDGSTDGCGEILTEYAAQDERIRVFRQQNAGPSSARNHGLREVRGEYIAFVDADDEVDPQYLELMLGSLKRYPQAGLAWCEVWRDDEKNICTESTAAVCYPNPLEHCVLHRKPRLSAVAWSLLFERRVLRNILFPEGIDYSEDILFAYRVFSTVGEAVYVPSPLYMYRKSESSLTNRSLTIHRIDHEVACCVQMALFSSEHPLTGKAQKKLEQTIALRFFRTIIKLIRRADPNDSKGWLVRQIRRLYELELQHIFVPTALPIKYRFLYWIYKRRYAGLNSQGIRK